ncbi:Oidioi.mRNA.OKI2018_I69.XSR.g16596.t2.cds [Oikopleura dioica]|uniref:Oidioi.mRNA.OKI2018_I69.XSR.g16596.t2.cds n=1 Tax=Oikopleura dioica TaxID=34765 RepID=A0ABN7SH41_OIKDI|nr:Oidioi.mRNA.OKI2018_I69.XSR.g16596.t2.cds [Oikopleura dioica]
MSESSVDPVKSEKKQKGKQRKLTHDELLRLCSVFEGELQARDQAITILKQQLRQVNTAREALKRDEFINASGKTGSDDEKTGNTVGQLKSIIEHQKESMRKLKREMCSTEQKHHQLMEEFGKEKRKHQEYMDKSDEFVNLLEADRQKMKLLLEEEKTRYDGISRNYEKLKKDSSEEIEKLKKFSMLLVEEKQAQNKKDERYLSRLKTAESEIVELEETLETLLKKLENEQEHSAQLERGLDELCDKHQQELEDAMAELEAERKKVAELEDTLESKIAQVKKLKGLHRNLQKTDDQLLELQEKLEKDGGRADLEEEITQLRAKVAEFENQESAQGISDEADMRRQVANELKAMEDLENELDRLRKTALIHKQLERFVEDSMFKLEELGGRFEIEEKKTSEMEVSMAEIKRGFSELDSTSANIIIVEEELRKDYRILEEELKRKSGDSSDKTSLMATIIAERDELKTKLEDESIRRKKLEEEAIEKSRDIMRSSSRIEFDSETVENLKNENLEMKSIVAALEDEINALKRCTPVPKKGSKSSKNSDEISDSEIKLLATEEDLENVKVALKQEEQKTQKQALQVQMMKDRMFKLEEREEKYKNVEEELKRALKKKNEAQTEAQSYHRQIADIKTLLEDEVREKRSFEKALEEATRNLKQLEKSGKSSSVQVQTDDDFAFHSRPSSRLGAMSPAVHIFDGPASHRIIPGGFKGCNFAAGMSQESLVRPSSIKNQNRIKLPASNEKVQMSFIAEHGQSATAKTVFKISKDKETGAPFITSSSSENSTVKVSNSESKSSTSLKAEPEEKPEEKGKEQQRQKSDGTSDVVEKSPKKPYTKVERVRKKRSMFEKASSTAPALSFKKGNTAAAKTLNEQPQPPKQEDSKPQTQPSKNSSALDTVIAEPQKLQLENSQKTKKSQIKSISKSFPSVVPRKEQKAMPSKVEKIEKIENIVETLETSTSVNSTDKGFLGHTITTKSKVKKASSESKISKVKSSTKNKEENIPVDVPVDDIPPPGELRRRFSEDSISSEASVSSDSSSRLKRTHVILLDTGLKPVTPHQVVPVGQEAVINLDEISSNTESSLVRQRAAIWKEKETGNPNAKLPIPVQTGARGKSRSRDSRR